MELIIVIFQLKTSFISTFKQFQLIIADIISFFVKLEENHGVRIVGDIPQS